MSMKTKAAFQLVLFGLACWTLISYFEASEGIAAFSRTKSGEIVFELNLTPFILFIAAASVYMYLHKKSRPARKQLLLPDEFEEQDERERMMTAKACRASYIAVYFSLPAAAVLLIFYPLFQSRVPFFPIIIVFIIMSIQHLSYVISFKKNEKNSGAL